MMENYQVNMFMEEEKDFSWFFELTKENIKQYLIKFSS